MRLSKVLALSVMLATSPAMTSAIVAKPANVAAAVANSAERTPDNVKLDEGRKPAELLNYLGLQEGMQGMRMNGERLIVVPSALAYGNLNTVPGVPPNSTLVFEVELLSIC